MFMGVVICPFFEAQTRGIYPLSQWIKPLPKVLKGLLSSGVVFCCCCCFLRGGGGGGLGVLLLLAFCGGGDGLGVFLVRTLAQMYKWLRI